MLKRTPLAFVSLAISACAVGSPEDVDYSSVASTAPAEGVPPARTFGGNAPPDPSTATDPGESDERGLPMPTPPSANAGVPAVQIIGRYDARDPNGPRIAFPGTRIVLSFEGESATLVLSESPGSGGPSELDVAIDHVWQPKLVLAPGAHAYPLATHLTPGRHTLELYRRSEASNGITQLQRVDFGAGRLLPPPARAERRIEIIGDSNAAGYGMEGVGPDCPGADWAARYENFHRAWSGGLGDRLHADISGVVVSGKGFVQNVLKSDTAVIGDVYERALPDDPTSVWDAAEFVPQAVVIMLGGNDFAVGEPATAPPASVDAVTAGYDALVRTVRAQHPSATIVLTLSPTISDEANPSRAVRTNMAATLLNVLRTASDRGDARVVAFAPNRASQHELTGCQGHGNAAYHARVADEIAAFLDARVTW